MYILSGIAHTTGCSNEYLLLSTMEALVLRPLELLPVDQL
jgi:hypothetical protein